VRRLGSGRIQKEKPEETELGWWHYAETYFENSLPREIRRILLSETG
jgi:hypothetical protein